MTPLMTAYAPVWLVAGTGWGRTFDEVRTQHGTFDAATSSNVVSDFSIAVVTRGIYFSSQHPSAKVVLLIVATNYTGTG